jgi:hypothetical protein
MALGMLSAFAADEPKPFSEAEKHLFLADRLSSLPKTITLHYKFSKTGTLEANFDDTVTLQVSEAKAGTKGRATQVNFLTGERKLAMPDTGEAVGNPVVMFYLEHDIREMHRITNGSDNYYRKRIRLTLEDNAVVKPITIHYAGADVAAFEITIDPYKDDPARSRYTRFANKVYLFIVSDHVPGGVYQMHSIMSDPQLPAGSKPMIDELLTLQENAQ